MRSEKTGMTKKQRENVELFLHLFADVETALKGRLNLQANDRTGVGALINCFEAKNSYWRDSASRLRQLADIRNVLTHQHGTAFGYPVAVTSNSIAALRRIREHLDRPESVSTRYCREVKTVSATNSLAHVVALAFENGFSQFPVVDDGQFRGLVTENEIIRWLGRRVKANASEVDLRRGTSTYFSGSPSEV